MNNKYKSNCWCKTPHILIRCTELSYSQMQGHKLNIHQFSHPLSSELVHSKPGAFKCMSPFFLPTSMQQALRSCDTASLKGVWYIQNIVLLVRNVLHLNIAHVKACLSCKCMQTAALLYITLPSARTCTQCEMHVSINMERFPTCNNKALCYSRLHNPSS